MFRYQLNPAGTVYLTVGHAGNQEGLYGGLVEDIDPNTGAPYCAKLSSIPGYLASTYPATCPTGAAAAHVRASRG